MPSSKNDQSNRKIDYISIDFEGNYFDTAAQVSRNKIQYFTDTFGPSILTGSTTVIGLFSHTPVRNSHGGRDYYLTSSYEEDKSGNKRAILSPNNNYAATGSIDAYRNGIEIKSIRHWDAGIAKITAGTQGHLVERTLYGVTELSLVSPDVYFEINVFNPVDFIESGGDPAKITYPIITSDVNELENYILNGIIEPFPIRPVITNLSINFPFEPHSTKGAMMDGNLDKRFASDQVLSIREVSEAPSPTFYLDAVDIIGLSDENSGVVTGPGIGYMSHDNARLSPYNDDRVYPRNSRVRYDSYLQNVINLMTSSLTTDTYVSDKEKSATCGFVYDDAYMGTDSVAYGGLNAGRRLFDRRVLTLRDSMPFIYGESQKASFEDKFRPATDQTVQYPSMIPVQFITGSAANFAGSIEINRPIFPGAYDSVERDCAISVKS